MVRLASTTSSKFRSNEIQDSRGSPRFGVTGGAQQSIGTKEGPDETFLRALKHDEVKFIGHGEKAPERKGNNGNCHPIFTAKWPRFPTPGVIKRSCLCHGARGGNGRFWAGEFRVEQAFQSHGNYLPSLSLCYSFSSVALWIGPSSPIQQKYSTIHLPSKSLNHPQKFE
ncbi:hypothetical protein CC2G_009263 [Coprinopsis cinerea AmutBmut pab1-1]|nr:hypothetical protein CC2G_009263 [Coprinopsis cinerea AmutBmut pab1-1]